MKLSLEGFVPIILRPFDTGDLERVPSLISSYEVCRFTGTTGSKTLADEQAWYEKIIAESNSAVWAICMAESAADTQGKVIGVTSLGFKNNRGSSGIIIFDRNYWGQGIASRCHRARCFYAHNNLGLKAIDSTVVYANQGSLKALLAVGYTITGTEYAKHFAKGQPHHLHRLTWVNPTEHKWAEFWGANTPPDDFNQARSIALRAIEQAKSEVRFL